MATVGPQSSWPGALRDDQLLSLVEQIRAAGAALSRTGGEQSDSGSGILAVYLDQAGSSELRTAAPPYTPVAVATFDDEPAVPGFVAIRIGTHLRLVQDELWTWLDEHTSITTWACPPSTRRRQLCLELAARWQPAFGCQ